MAAIFTSREFNRDVSAAKRAATEEPVVITDRGEPAYVLLSIDQYRAVKADNVDLVARLRMEDDIEIEFGPVTSGSSLKVPDL